MAPSPGTSTSIRSAHSSIFRPPIRRRSIETDSDPSHQTDAEGGAYTNTEGDTATSNLVEKDSETVNRDGTTTDVGTLVTLGATDNPTDNFSDAGSYANSIGTVFYSIHGGGGDNASDGDSGGYSESTGEDAAGDPDEDDSDSGGTTDNESESDSFSETATTVYQTTVNNITKAGVAVESDGESESFRVNDPGALQ